MENSVKALKEQPAASPAVAASQSSHHQSHTSVPTEVPYEMRTRAVIGGLGWDMNSSSLKRKAEETLDAAGVPRTSWVGLCPMVGARDLGSRVELHSLRLLSFVWAACR